LFTNKPKEKKKIECDNEDNQAVKVLKESDIKKPKISRPKTQSSLRSLEPKSNEQSITKELKLNEQSKIKELKSNVISIPEKNKSVNKNSTA